MHLRWEGGIQLEEVITYTYMQSIYATDWSKVSGDTLTQVEEGNVICLLNCCLTVWTLCLVSVC